MNCVKCGNPVVEGNKFCMICGTPVQAAPQAPVAGNAPAPGPAPETAPVAPVEINPQTVAQAQPQPQAQSTYQQIPYAAPTTDGTNINIPIGRKYRVVCPDCQTVGDTLKRDASFGFACPRCGKAYAYGGQLLIYRMGNGLPSAAIVPVAIYIDNVFYGEVANRESVRIMLSSGTHVIGLGARPGTRINRMQSNQFQITVGPQTNNLAFKVSVVYRYMGPYGLELKQCNPEEIPDI